VEISGLHVKFLLEHLEFMRVNVEPVYIGPLMDRASTFKVRWVQDQDVCHQIGNSRVSARNPFQHRFYLLGSR
jgi:hypothetical protein